jgi:hypothetical protein
VTDANNDDLGPDDTFADDACCDSDDTTDSMPTVFRPVSDVARDHIRLQALNAGRSGNPLNQTPDSDADDYRYGSWN